MTAKHRRLADQVVLITGAADGIGAATARQLIAQGAQVALVDRDASVIELAIALGDRAAGFVADVSDPAAIDRAVDAVAERFGRLDALVVNAGILGSAGTAASVDPADFERVIAVNLVGAFRTVQAGLPHITASNGYVLVIASVAAVIPTPTFAAYGAGKAGVEAFARALRIEVSASGVDVGVAYFGLIDTAMVAAAAASPSVFTWLPWPFSGSLPASAAANAIVRGIERRERTICAPAWVELAVAFRGVTFAAEAVLTLVPSLRRVIATSGRAPVSIEEARR